MRKFFCRPLSACIIMGLFAAVPLNASAAEDGGYREHKMGQVTLQTYGLRTGNDGFEVYLSLNGYAPQTLSVKTEGDYTAAEQQSALDRGIDEINVLPWLVPQIHSDSPVTDLESLYRNLNNSHTRPKHYIYPTHISLSEANYAIIQPGGVSLLGLSFHSNNRMVTIAQGEIPDYRSYTNYFYLDGQLVLEWTMSKSGYVTSYQYHDATFHTATEEGQITVSPATSKIYLNGEEVSLGAYLIDGTNYIRLRDIAHLSNSTPAQFDIAWHQETSQIELLPGQSYTPTGVELAELSPATAIRSRSVIARTYPPLFANDSYTSAELMPVAYNINGSNFYRLRDIAHIADFTVRWDEATKSVHIESEKNTYTGLMS